MNIEPVQVNYSPLEDIQPSKTFSDHITTVFLATIPCPPLPPALFTLKGKTQDLRKTVDRIQDCKRYETTWKAIKLLSCAVLIGATASAIFKISQKMVNFSYNQILKGSLHGLVLAALLYVGYRGVASLDKDEKEPIQDLINYLSKKSPVFASIIGASKIKDLENQAKTNEASLHTDLQTCRAYLNDNFTMINDALAVELNGVEARTTPVKEKIASPSKMKALQEADDNLIKIQDQLREVQAELAAINQTILAVN